MERKEVGGSAHVSGDVFEDVRFEGHVHVDGAKDITEL